MFKKIIMLAAAGIVASATASSAGTINYNFKAESNSGGLIGESIFDNYNTSSTFAGPNLNITASAGGAAAFVYFDNGNAGMGVCKIAEAGAQINTATGGSANQCAPASDDGITALDEKLHFVAGDAMRIESITVNSNHDTANIMDSIWSIAGFSYTAMDDGTAVGGGDVRFDIGMTLYASDSFNLFSTAAPDSYISAIAVATVPLPASALMLLAALGGLGAMRRKSA